MNSHRELGGRIHLGVLTEEDEKERRVALVPDDVRRAAKLASIFVERDAGVGAGFSDDTYRAAGASVVERSRILDAVSVLVTVRALNEISHVRRGAPLVSLGGRDPAVAERMRDRGLNHLGLERVPRIRRAQGMDALTSQATVAGYAAVLEGARHLREMLPMTTTAAGNIRPARTIALGAGVAGLQAIAVASRVGAVVHGFDVRQAAREQVESLGAKFIGPTPSQATAETAGGYANAQSDEQQHAVRSALIEHLASMQLIVTSAQVPGRRAPILIDEEVLGALAEGP